MTGTSIFNIIIYKLGSYKSESSLIILFLIDKSLKT